MRMSAGSSGSSKDGCVVRQETRGTPLLFPFLAGFRLVLFKKRHATSQTLLCCCCTTSTKSYNPFLSSSFSPHHRRKHSCAYFNRTKSCVFCPLCLNQKQEAFSAAANSKKYIVVVCSWFWLVNWWWIKL